VLLRPQSALGVELQFFFEDEEALLTGQLHDVMAVVLIAPQPGEVHLLGAALDAEVMWRAGWDVRTGFPPTDEALQALVSGTWFDALDLSLSAAFRREHWLPRMTETIARARGASRNPKLLVSASGRIFLESNGNRAHVGADLNCATALQCMPLILRLGGMYTTASCPSV
jgi:hypothetical protein